MSQLFWLTDEPIERPRPFFPKATASRVVMADGC